MPEWGINSYELDIVEYQWVDTVNSNPGHLTKYHLRNTLLTHWIIVQCWVKNPYRPQQKLRESNHQCLSRKKNECCRESLILEFILWYVISNIAWSGMCRFYCIHTYSNVTYKYICMFVCVLHPQYICLCTVVQIYALAHIHRPLISLDVCHNSTLYY